MILLKDLPIKVLGKVDDWQKRLVRYAVLTNPDMPWRKMIHDERIPIWFRMYIDHIINVEPAKEALIRQMCKALRSALV